MSDHHIETPAHDQFKSFIQKGDQHGLTSQAADKGIVIPTEIEQTIRNKVIDLSPLRQLCSVTTVSSDSFDIVLERERPKVGWVAETEQRIETDHGKLEKRRILVHEQYARLRLSQKLLDDARMPIDNWLLERVASQMAAEENRSFIFGDGKNQPKGFLTYTGKKEWGCLETLSTGQKGGFKNDASALDLLFKTIDSLPSPYLSQSCWIMSRSVQSKLRMLRDETTGTPLWQTGQGLSSLAAQTLLGYPVIISDDMPGIDASKSTLSIAFGNFYQGYQIVDRQDFNILRDPFSAKPYVEFYATRRLGGDVMDFDAIKLIQFGEA